MQYRREAKHNAHTVGATQDKYTAFISESFGICLFRGKVEVIIKNRKFFAEIQSVSTRHLRNATNVCRERPGTADG